MRRGYASLEPKTDELRLMAHVTSQANMNEAWDQYFGKTLFTYTKREYVSIMIYPHRDKIILVSAAPDFPTQQVFAVREIILNAIP